MRRRVIFFVLVMLWPAWAVAADVPAGLAALADGGVGVVTHVVDGDTVVLADGREVRLVGIQAPKLPLGRAGFKPWPLGAEAKARLEALVSGHAVRLRLGTQPVDRHGRLLAHVLRQPAANENLAAPMWVQGALLAEGLARVYTFHDNRRLADAMLARERTARDARAGIWAVPYYAVRTVDNVRFDMNTFQLVEGRVLDAAQVRDRIYLNFGPDWRRDFTIKVRTRDADLFAEAGVDLVRLKGSRVRVRGWIRDENGPMIVLDHPERLEVLGP